MAMLVIVEALLQANHRPFGYSEKNQNRTIS